MKRKHTQARKANRTFSPHLMTRGMSGWLMGALFGTKSNSKSSKNRAPKAKVMPYTGQKLGKQHNTQHKV